LNSLRSSSKGMAGTPRWLAPELITKRGAKHSFESDIYSLGMVIWEIVAQETVPFKDLEEDREVYGAFYRGERETIPQDTPEKITEIINSCWQENPQERIGLENILTKLEENNRNDSYQSQIEVINISNNTWN
jgi:serine/threonine protein kinase